MEDTTVSVGLSDLACLQKEILEFREKKTSIDKESKTVAANIDALEAKLLQHLKDTGLTSFKSPYGQVSISSKFSVRLPQDSEDWQRLYGYLRDRGHYDAMISVSSQKLNAYYREELEQARMKGDIDFQIPGLAEPSVHETLSFRKG